MWRGYIGSTMSSRQKAIFPFVLIISSCTAATEESPEPELESSVDDDDDIQIVYREASASFEIVLNVEELSRIAQGSTIEMKVDVMSPDGITTRHDRSWTRGEDQEIPRIETPVVHDGAYEVVLTELAIDGRVLERPFTRQRMEVLGDRDHEGHHDDGWDHDHDDGWDDDDDDGGHHDDGWDDDGHHDDGWDHDDGDHDDGWDDDDDHGDDDDDHKCKRGKTIHGDDSSDELHGSKRNDIIHGQDGKDRLWGYECHDRLYGGKGRDILKGGEGDDFLHGGGGEDTCVGGSGHDEFRNCERVKK
jgi:hypothetical protein